MVILGSRVAAPEHPVLSAMFFYRDPLTQAVYAAEHLCQQ